MKKSVKIWVKADKFQNIYKIRILHNKITENYKIVHNVTLTQMNSNTTKFMSKLFIKDRLGKRKMCLCSI